MSLYNVIGRNEPDYLLAAPQGADVIAIPCEPGAGVISRGTVMYRKATGLYAPADSGSVNTSNMLVILDEEINTDANLAIAESARAYRAGRLVYSRVKLKDGAALTDAHRVTLRGQGIVFDQLDGEAPAIYGGRIAITYKANGGTGADIIAYADYGDSYSIAANTFTPPHSKTFQKWNTSPDGNGTAHEASSSYTAKEDLVLYAIWA